MVNTFKNVYLRKTETLFKTLYVMRKLMFKCFQLCVIKRRKYLTSIDKKINWKIKNLSGNFVLFIYIEKEIRILKTNFYHHTNLRAHLIQIVCIRVSVSIP